MASLCWGVLTILVIFNEIDGLRRLNDFESFRSDVIADGKPILRGGLDEMMNNMNDNRPILREGLDDVDVDSFSMPSDSRPILRLGSNVLTDPLNDIDSETPIRRPISRGGLNDMMDSLYMHSNLRPILQGGAIDLNGPNAKRKGRKISSKGIEQLLNNLNVNIDFNVQPKLEQSNRKDIKTPSKKVKIVRQTPIKFQAPPVRSDSEEKPKVTAKKPENTAENTQMLAESPGVSAEIPQDSYEKPEDSAENNEGPTDTLKRHEDGGPPGSRDNNMIKLLDDNKTKKYILEQANNAFANPVRLHNKPKFSAEDNEDPSQIIKLTDDTKVMSKPALRKRPKVSTEEISYEDDSELSIMGTAVPEFSSPEKTTKRYHDTEEAIAFLKNGDNQSDDSSDDETISLVDEDDISSSEQKYSQSKSEESPEKIARQKHTTYSPKKKPEWTKDLKKYIKLLSSKYQRNGMIDHIKPVIKVLERTHKMTIKDIDVDKRGKVKIVYRKN